MSIQSKSPAAAELEAYFDSPANYAHAADVAALVLESYGAGYAWLRPSTDAGEDEDALYTITDTGRDYLRLLAAHEGTGGAVRSPTVASPC